jgi:hypothetical protein
MTGPTFEVISLGPSAGGWRAVFSGDNGGGGRTAGVLGGVPQEGSRPA